MNHVNHKYNKNYKYIDIKLATIRVIETNEHNNNIKHKIVT